MAGKEYADWVGRGRERAQSLMQEAGFRRK
jgi:hypothetical protein